MVTSLLGRRPSRHNHEWTTAPPYRVPHPAFLIGAAGLLVTASVLVPMLILGQIRPGAAHTLFLIVTTVQALAALIPVILRRARTTTATVIGLAFGIVMPLLISLTSIPDAPVQVWANLLVIPTLVVAASGDSTIYRLQLAAGAVVGPVIIVSASAALTDGVGNSAIFLWVLITSGLLTRRAWGRVQARFAGLHDASHRDELTGLFNRRGLLAGFMPLRATTIEQGESHHKAGGLGILLIDIDHFTVINDEHGHPYGDQVLQQICGLIAAHSPPDALIARIGGEELVVLVAGPAEPVAVGIQRAIARATIHLGLTVSIGIVDADPVTCDRADRLWALIHLADSAMYLAKQGGRARIVRLPQTEERDSAVLAGLATPVEADHGEDPAVLELSPSSPAVARPAAEAATDPADLPRLFGLHYIAMASIGFLAYLVPIAVDPDAAVIPLFLAILISLVVLGGLNLALGDRLPRWFRLVPLFGGELAVLLALPAIPQLDMRLSAFGLIQVPLLIASDLLPRRVLLWHFPMIVVVAALTSARAGQDPALWLQHTVAMTALICVPSGILYWLRIRCASAAAELHILGTRDPLTGLLNRSGLESTILTGTARSSRQLYVIQVNINGFKLLNDRYGHGAGDEALMLLGRTLARVARSHPATVVARTTGDRFVLAKLGRRDRALLASIEVAVGGLEFGVSLGQAAGFFSGNADLWALTAAAERDLAKRKG